MKKLLSVCLSLLLVISLTIPAMASDVDSNSDLVEKISQKIDMSRFTVEHVDEIPAGVTPIIFDNWEDAADWLNSLEQIKLVDNASPSYMSTYDFQLWPDENYEFKGDVGSISYFWIPDGSGSYSDSMEYAVPGLSAQTVTANHYFEYSNGKVTDWSVYTNISGLGLATYSSTYEKLERHDVSGWVRFFGVCVGNLGYYLEIGGVPIGVYEALELTYVLSRPVQNVSMNGIGALLIFSWISYTVIRLAVAAGIRLADKLKKK